MNDFNYDDVKPNRKLFGVSIQWLLFVAGLIAVAAIVAYGLGWFTKPLELTAPDNLQRLSREANDAWQALEAKKATIKNRQDQALQMNVAYGDEMGVWPQGKRDEYLQLQTQINNLKASYNADCGQYNAFWLDEWRSLPAPDDIPTRCDLMQ